MNLTVSGTRNAIHVQRQGMLAHIPCHGATVTIRSARQPDIDIHAIFTPSPFPCWAVGANKFTPEKVEGPALTPEFSVSIDDDARVVVKTEDGDRMEIF